MAIKDVTLLSEKKNLLLVAGVEKEEKFIIPTGDYVFQEDDNVLTMFPKESYGKFLNFFDKAEKKVKKVVISGASLLGIEAALVLEKRVEQVILLEPEKDMAELAAEKLEKTEVIHGSYDDEGILKAAHVETADFFIAVHKKTEDNMMAALMAKENGTRETLVITTDSRHQQLFNSTGINHIINPYQLTASQILNVVRGDFINDIAEISRGEVEALELIVEEGSKIEGKELKTIWQSIQGKALVGALIKKQKVIVPQGDTIMETGDRAVVISLKENLTNLKKIFLKK